MNRLSVTLTLFTLSLVTLVTSIHPELAITKNEIDGLVRRQKRSFGKNENAAQEPSEEPNLTLVEANRHGYRTEEHFVTTPDGYILRLDRVKGSRHKGRSSPGRVVLMMHGTFGTSFGFVANGPDYSLGLRLADANYDVWMGNFRGTPPSRNHTSMNPDSDVKYWKFSYDELALKDLPTMINYVCKTTENQKIFYVGYSNGARSLLFSAGSGENHIVNKVRLFVNLANNGAWDYSDRDTSIMRIIGKSYKLAELFNIREIAGESAYFRMFTSLACGSSALTRKLCIKTIGKILDKPPVTNELLLKKDRDAVQYISAMLGGTSMRVLAHQNQLIGGEMRRFNHGFFGNLYHYQKKEAPTYDFGKLSCPTALFYSTGDVMTPESDIENFKSKVPNLIHAQRITEGDFDHNDFLYSKKATKLVYKDVVNVMNRMRAVDAVTSEEISQMDLLLE